MILHPLFGTAKERYQAVARQYLAHHGFRIVASAGYANHIPALLRAVMTAPKYIFDALTDDELMLYAQGVGGQFRQRNNIVHFEYTSNDRHLGVVAGEPRGFCASTDTIAIAEGHRPVNLATGKPLEVWDV